MLLITVLTLLSIGSYHQITKAKVHPIRSTKKDFLQTM